MGRQYPYSLILQSSLSLVRFLFFFFFFFPIWHIYPITRLFTFSHCWWSLLCWHLFLHLTMCGRCERSDLPVRSTNTDTHARTHAQLRIWTKHLHSSSSTFEYIKNWINQDRSNVRSIDRRWSSCSNSQWYFDLIHWQEAFLSPIVRGSDERRRRRRLFTWRIFTKLCRRFSRRCHLSFSLSLFFVDHLKHPLSSQQTSFDMFNDRDNLWSICPSMNWKHYKSNERSMWHVEQKMKMCR